MNRYEREKPGTGGASAAVNYAINTGAVKSCRETWQLFNEMVHETRRALLGIDKPSAWCGERNARLRRFVSHFQEMPGPRLP